MAAKLLHSLTDENPDLQKQIGCMTGIFQLFDRQHMLTGGRRIVGHSPKRLISGSPHFNDDTSEKEFSSIYQRPAVAEKQRLSTESSRPSFSSSSRSSSFSSLDCNRTVQPEPLAFDRVIFPETPSRDQTMNQIKTSQYGRQTLDIRDVVKDSMNREAQVKSTLREEVAESITKHRDSPRPMQLSQPFDGNYGAGLYAKHNTPVDLKESLRVLAKLREAPWYYNEPRQLSRSSSYHSKDGSITISKDAPRFSYDGKETRHLSFESRDISKSALKQLPRLSLDSSRETPLQSFHSESKSNFYTKSSQQDAGYANVNSVSLQQTSGTQARPPSVVAKLMGLEALPDSSTPSDSNMRLTKNCQVDDTIPISRSSEVSDQCKHIQISSSTRNLWKDPTSPRWKNVDSAMKPTSKFPIEPAPWRHFEKTRASEKLTFRNTKTPAKLPNSFPSVYSEIEKRLKDLEFTESGKDLRALKQILEAMQVKGLLETQKVQESKFSGQKEHQQKYASSLQTAKLTHQRMRQSDQVTASTSRGSNSLRNFESPIVIMKPAKLMEESGIPPSMIPLDGSSCPSKQQGAESFHGRKGAVATETAKDQTPKASQRVNIIISSDSKTNNRTSKSSQASARSKESTSGSLKTSGSISPRLQQKKLELEKRSRPPTPPSDSNRSRKQANKQPMESNSPGGRRRPKISIIQQNDDLLSENEISVRSNGSVISDSKEDIEVTSSLVSFEKNSIRSPKKSVESLISSCIEKRLTSVLSEDGSLAAMVAPEYPSPVSVLDNLVYADESPLPGKCVPEVLDNRYKDPDRVSSIVPCNPSDDVFSTNIGSGVTPEFNRRKLQNIENLVQKLRRLNSSHDEGRTDYIASLCENTNPDHRYVSEILLASGLLLRDIGSSITVFQFHPSGLPINPELFLVLEQTRASTSSVKEEYSNGNITKEKVHRKLIFDLVNEILATKLAFLGTFSEPWLKPQKLAKNSLNAQKLLRELCSEIEQLLQAKKSSKCELEDEDDELKNIFWEDVVHRSGSWTDFKHEISAIVLDVERLVFKDLIGEIVRGEGDNFRNKPSRRRQLSFTK